MTATLLRVAAVQPISQPGQRDANLRHAETLVEQAAAQGAQLVLLPELMPGGYCLTEAIWDTAEPFAGPTTRWLTGLARRLRLGSKAELAILERDPRCRMISLDPDTGEHNPEVFRKVAQTHATFAGIYCAVLVEGLLSEGDTVEVVD